MKLDELKLTIQIPVMPDVDLPDHIVDGNTRRCRIAYALPVTIDMIIAIEQERKRERWSIRCKTLQATDEQIADYYQSAIDYAATTTISTRLVVDELMLLAVEMQQANDPWPASAEQAIAWARHRYFAALLLGR